MCELKLYSESSRRDRLKTRQLFEVERRSTAGLNSKTMMNCMRQPTETIALNFQLPRLGFVHESRKPLAIIIPVYCCCSCTTWPTNVAQCEQIFCVQFSRFTKAAHGLHDRDVLRLYLKRCWMRHVRRIFRFLSLAENLIFFRHSLTCTRLSRSAVNVPFVLE